MPISNSGKTLNEEGKAKLAKPMDNTDMNLGYRKKMVQVFIYRTLKEISEQGFK